jgi:hypothetical protein
VLSRNFEFMEKDDVPYAIERLGGRVFRMCGRSMVKWEEIEDDDRAFRITSNAFKVSESYAIALADEFEEDIREAAGILQVIQVE